MADHRFKQLRIGLTVAFSLAIWGLLAWRHVHDGVPAHHLLHNPALPRVSDWFGAVLIPLLTWCLLGLSRRRKEDAGSQSLQLALVGLLAGLAYGAAMSVSFFSGHEQITGYLFFGLLPLALFLPVYRPECLLGFILGMSVVFGAVLPTLFGSIMALATFVIHRFIGLPLQGLIGLRVGPKLKATE
ncbi:MAG: hypothetical protein EA418_10380 [Wenzhouxiangellaceae bacterium]|nr:MAG: hypothetical protein EA418_10380 [Wenzhouxiangellaceae bacterium]